MNSNDFLIRMVNDHVLGNYFEVFDGYKDYKESSANEKDRVIHFQILVYLHKSIIYAIRNNQEEVSKYQKDFSDQVPLMALFVKYFLPTLDKTDHEEVNGLLAELEKENIVSLLNENEFNQLKVIFKNNLYFSYRSFNQFTKISPVYKELCIDHLALVYNAHSIFRQKLECQRLITDLNTISDEHIITHMLVIDFSLCNEMTDEAKRKIEEVKEKFGDSVKLNNLKAVCSVFKLDFEEVE